MIILDTNVWYAICDANDSSHSAASKLFESLEEPVLMPEYILVELLNLLVRKRGKEWTDQFLGKLLVSKDCVITPNSASFTNEVLQDFLRSERVKLSFVDHALLYLSTHHKVITFDKELAKHL